MSLEWYPDDYADPAKTFVSELIALANKYSDYVELPRKRRESQPGLMIYDKNSRNALMEYRPQENRMFARPDSYNNLSETRAVPWKLVDAFHSDIGTYGRDVADPKVFIDHLGRIFDTLYLGKEPADEPQSEVVRRIRPMSADPEEGYLPTRTDCENAYRELAEEGESLLMLNLLDQIQRNVEKMGKDLHPQWRSLTEKNLAEWLNS
jgi:hypothetical protein